MELSNQQALLGNMLLRGEDHPVEALEVDLQVLVRLVRERRRTMPGQHETRHEEPR